MRALAARGGRRRSTLSREDAGWLGRDNQAVHDERARVLARETCGGGRGTPTAKS